MTGIATQMVSSPRYMVVLVGISALAVVLVVISPLFDGGSVSVQPVGAELVTDAPGTASEDLNSDPSSATGALTAVLEPRDPIPVAQGRTTLSSPVEPGSVTGSAAAPAEEPGSLDIAIARPGEGASVEPVVTTRLHPTPSWVNAFSGESTLDGRPLAIGDIVTAFDPQGVLIGHFKVQSEGKYGLMPMYMDDPSTELDEGAEPGDLITFRINGFVAETAGPREAVWMANGDLLMLDLSATSG